MNIEQALPLAELWQKDEHVPVTMCNVLQSLTKEIHSLRAQLPSKATARRIAIEEMLNYHTDISELPSFQFGQIADACLDALEHPENCTGIVYDIESGRDSRDHRCYTLHRVGLCKEGHPDISIKEIHNAIKVK